MDQILRIKIFGSLRLGGRDPEGSLPMLVRVKKQSVDVSTSHLPKSPSFTSVTGGGKRFVVVSEGGKESTTFKKAPLILLPCPKNPNTSTYLRKNHDCESFLSAGHKGIFGFTTKKVTAISYFFAHFFLPKEQTLK